MQPARSIEATSQAEAFLANGYVGPVRVLNPEQCALLRRHFAANLPQEGNKTLAAIDPLIHEIATHPVLLNLLRATLGENVSLWGASVVPRTAGQVHHWHTDIETSAPEGGFVTVWLGFQNTSRASGLRLIPGSHRYGATVQEARVLKGVARGEEDILDLAGGYDPHARIELPEVSDGEAILFDGRVWHGSRNMMESGMRAALLLQYVLSDKPVYTPDFSKLDWPFRFLESPRPPVIPVLGKADNAANLVAPPPGIGPALPTTLHQFSLPLQLPDSKTNWKSFHIARGSTPNLRSMSFHASVLAPGYVPHLPHAHLDEEILIVLDGEADLLITNGPQDPSPRVERMAAGSFIYYPPYQFHTIGNSGTRPVSYLMFRWMDGPWNAGRRLGMSGWRPTGEEPDGPRAGFRPKLIFEGGTQCLQKLHVHLSDLTPGAGYESHADAHDIAMVVLEGEIETVGRRISRGGVLFIPAGEMHGMHNPGQSDAKYLVIEFHGFNAGTPRSLRLSTGALSLMGPVGRATPQPGVNEAC